MLCLQVERRDQFCVSVKAREVVQGDCGSTVPAFATEVPRLCLGVFNDII